MKVTIAKANPDFLAICKDFDKACQAGEFISVYQWDQMIANPRRLCGSHGDWIVGQDEDGQWWKRRSCQF